MRASEPRRLLCLCSGKSRVCASESLCSPLLCFAVTASAPRSTCRAISRPAHCSCRASEPSSSRSSARPVKYLTVQCMTGDAATARAVLDAALLPPVVHAVVSAASVATCHCFSTLATSAALLSAHCNVTRRRLGVFAATGMGRAAGTERAVALTSWLCCTVVVCVGAHTERTCALFCDVLLRWTLP